ncbi:MAG: hypothetical protein GX382_00660 [Syntrophomonadaceae bacterium]|jgi:hypothetical protein|nr:hypothetical protein [Syntrophomonadaceae bacterium]
MTKIRMKVRFDYLGKTRQGKFFGGKNGVQVAEEIRQHKVSLVRNVPIQGIFIEDIDMSQEVYTVLDEVTGKMTAFAPVTITYLADTLEDAVKFAMKEEFRTVEVLEPEDLTLTRLDIERLLMKVCDEMHNYRSYLERKLDNWR